MKQLYVFLLLLFGAFGASAQISIYMKLTGITTGNGVKSYSDTIEVDGYGSPVLIYPNPSRGMVYLQIPGADAAPGAAGQAVTVRVFTTTGRLVYATVSPAGQTAAVDLSGQSAGIYTIECLGDTVTHGRVLIIR